MRARAFGWGRYNGPATLYGGVFNLTARVDVRVGAISFSLVYWRKAARKRWRS